MSLSDEEKAGLGVAFNEAAWLGAEVDERRRQAGITLAVHSLPVSGPPPKDSRVQVILRPVGRVCAVLSSPAGDILPMNVAGLLATVQRFGGCPIYGWEFIDAHIPSLAASAMSLQVDLGTDGLSHVLYLFQEGGVNGSLRLWLWFDAMELRTPSGDPISLDDFITAGCRWWDGLYAGDPRTSGAGISPLTGSAG